MKKVLACEFCKGNCMGCFHADECNAYNDIAPYDRFEVAVEVKTASMALCDGRHPIPDATDGAIFGNAIEDPTDLVGMEDHARSVLAGVERLNLYVTGLTVALIAVLNVCRDNGITVTLYHFNRETGDYFPQVVR